MLCQSCNRNKAIVDPIWGVLECKSCQNKNVPEPSDNQVEFTSEHIKNERKEFASDIEQPHRAGHLNKKWVELYGEKAALRQGYSKKEIKDASYVWDSIRYYKDGT